MYDGCIGRKTATAAAATAAAKATAAATADKGRTAKAAKAANSGTQTSDAGMVISNIVSLAPVQKSMSLLTHRLLISYPFSTRNTLWKCILCSLDFVSRVRFY